MSNDPLWTQDINILLQTNRLIEFFPTKQQTYNERINAIVRLSLYISIALALYHSNIKYFSIFIFILFFTSIIQKHHPKLKNNTQQNTLPITQQKLNNFKIEEFNTKEQLENEIRPDNTQEQCTTPTIDNPFMNVTMKDYMNFDTNGFIVDRPPACDPNDPTVKKLIDETFSNNLYRDVSDVFGKTNSQRNYFTMPWTTIPNKQDEFARWLYLSPKTCKEDQDYCLQYEDIRYKRFIMPNPERNPTSTKQSENINSQ